MEQHEKPSLDGRVALVTGSSRGIGRAIAQRLAAAGATVIVTARSVQAPRAGQRFGQAQIIAGTLAETVELIENAGGRAIALAADLEKPEDRDSLITRAIAAAGRLDILVNNAGFADYARVEDMPDATFDRTVDHYLRAPFALIKQVVPHMKERGDGWIVNIGSVTALQVGRPYADYTKSGGDVVYASIKAALHRFTQGIAAELIDHGIAANVVGPSTAIRTAGANALIPEDYPTEDVEYLAETVLAMCHRPASERTGLIAFSMHYPWATRLQVMSLDGKTPLPRREPPPWSHPAIHATGE
ncbi:SDR family NAD(P)-dependent oxidoreductase [Sphingomonas sp. C3-2]|uniref:SDR family NAD(P)-dependent oxidoreductase n=1 Tax=Sphingomonas sp. C3-2 TaxID=3062169 RepID=UPI00294B9370|nr:SDR family NAD(P)-dependent oxidoreductase [Sphingomonas sp. C3-2]WOK35352.1 SDR family NAD(P)-dependent oxidoreductase [Sphingomonas sp. C3-2]